VAHRDLEGAAGNVCFRAVAKLTSTAGMRREADLRANGSIGAVTGLSVFGISRRESGHLRIA